mmetsp:Transcript_7144/g.8005  ORF Transcript_7144/g.8005 Transcript_7144/m.8005 type:complete len:108 (+) Transcript_7144:164-487(+)
MEPETLAVQLCKWKATHRKVCANNFKKVHARKTASPQKTHLHSSIFRASVMLRKRTHAVDLLLQDVTAPVPVETCAICHDDMTGHDEAHPEVRLPCGHRYQTKSFHV